MSSHQATFFDGSRRLQMTESIKLPERLNAAEILLVMLSEPSRVLPASSKKGHQDGRNGLFLFHTRGESVSGDQLRNGSDQTEITLWVLDFIAERQQYFGGSQLLRRYCARLHDFLVCEPFVLKVTSANTSAHGFLLLRVPPV